MGHCILIAERGLQPRAGLAQLESALQELPVPYQDGWKIAAVDGAVLAVSPEREAEPVTRPFHWGDKRYLGIGFGELYGSHRWNQNHRQVTTDLTLLCEQVGKQDASLESCNGTFLAARYDTLAGELAIVNDRFGLNPLYYSPKRHRMVASTIIQAVVALRSTPVSLDPVSFLDFLAYGHLLDEYTLLKEIALLPPACELRFSSDRGLRLTRYWRLAFNKDIGLSDDFERALDDFAQRMRDAVSVRSSSDSDVGTALSGGLDSRMVIGFAESARNIRTYTWFGRPDSAELPCARQVSNVVGTEHKEIPFTSAEFTDAVDEFLEVSGGHCDASFAPRQAFGRRLADDGIKVLLSGMGGDALSGAHHDLWTYLAPEGQLARALAFSRAHRRGSSGPMLKTLCRPEFFAVHRSRQRSRFEQAFVSCGQGQHSTLADHWNCFDLRQKQRRRINEVFCNYERFVNARPPFYDYRVFDVFLSLPVKWKRRQAFYWKAMCRYMPDLADVPSTSTGNRPVSERKPEYAEIDLLRAKMRDVLPAPVLPSQTKQSGASPLDDWFYSELSRFFSARLLDGTLSSTGIIDKDGLERSLRETRTAPKSARVFYRLLTLHGAVNCLL